MTAFLFRFIWKTCSATPSVCILARRISSAGCGSEGGRGTHVPVSDHIEGQSQNGARTLLLGAHLSREHILQPAALVAGARWRMGTGDVRGAAMRSISSRKLRSVRAQISQASAHEEKIDTYNSAESSSLRTRRRRSIARTDGWCQSSVMSSALACSIRAFGSRPSSPVSLDSEEKVVLLAFGSSWCEDLERRSARRPSLRLSCQPLRRRGVP